MKTNKQTEEHRYHTTSVERVCEEMEDTAKSAVEKTNTTKELEILLEMEVKYAKL